MSRTFTLNPRGSTTHARASRYAMRAYAKVIEEGSPELALELREWALEEQRKDLEAQERQQEESDA